jgi:crotonobetainyl-CoA:carnitine CoA-transferase CaiB-like acyl-CoA transferase
MPAPLDDLVVLDFSHALAGPYCTMLMAAYGAKVYKIESPTTPDMGRTWAPPQQGGEASYFLGLNSGKRGVAVNLKDPRGIELCRSMAARADIVVENMRPGTLERLGLGYDALRPSNPRLVYCSISGYGQDGPSRDEPAMDLIMQAACGLISTTGTVEGATARCGHSVADITAGMFALIGVLMALEARHRTGVGQFVDVAMLDSMISAMASNYAHLFGSGIVPKPLGTAFATIVPYACFPTADREIAIAVASEKLWRAFCDAVERPDLVDDPRFATNRARVRNRGELEPMVCRLLAARPAADWLRILTDHGVPCAPVRDLDEVAAHPQAEARGMFPLVPHSTAGSVRVTGLPIKFADTPGAVTTGAPLVGEHTRASLGELLGMEDAEFDRLASGGVVAEARR